MLTLEDAITLATKAHKGQKDLSGMPYILHPLHVMSKMDTITEMIVAVLHDVTEDTDYTIEHIRCSGITEEINDALIMLDKNKHDKENQYEKMIKIIKNNPVARKVKIADLEHNMDLRRIINREDMEEVDLERFRKYMWAWSYLTGK